MEDTKFQMPEKESEKAEIVLPREHVNIKKIFNPLRELLTEDQIIFMCKAVKSSGDVGGDHQAAICNSTLFLSPQIESIYVLEYLKIGFIIDLDNNPDLQNKFNLSEKIEHEDEELKQSDCIYTLVFCRNCGVNLGRIFHSVPAEKQFLLDKCLILTDKLQIVKLNTNFFEPTQEDLSNYIRCKIKDSEEIQELCEINSQVKENCDSLYALVKRTQDYLSIKDSIDNSEKYVESLNRLTKYVEHSFKKLKLF